MVEKMLRQFFIIQNVGAFGVSATRGNVILTNHAKNANVYWIVEGLQTTPNLRIALRTGNDLNFWITLTIATPNTKSWFYVLEAALTTGPSLFSGIAEHPIFA